MLVRTLKPQNNRVGRWSILGIDKPAGAVEPVSIEKERRKMQRVGKCGLRTSNTKRPRF